MLRRRGCSRRREPRGSPTAGAVTAEIAAALPALVLVTVAVIWTIAVALAHLRCADAAREAVRAAARGDQHEVVEELAAAVAPAGAALVLTERDGMIVVEVAVEVRPPLPFADRLPAPTVRATAAAVGETR
jgi:hypothetical protein